MINNSMLWICKEVENMWCINEWILGFVLRWPIFSYCGNPLLDDLKSWENPDEEKNEMLTGQLDEDAANYKLISIENQPELEI